MRRALFTITLIAFLAVPMSAQTAVVTNDTKAIFATLVRWADAVRDRDLKTLEALFADDVIITLVDGQTRGKAQELDAFRPDPNVRTISIVNEAVGVKMFTDAAVVTALVRMRFAAGSRESSLAMRYTAVFARK